MLIKDPMISRSSRVVLNCDRYIIDIHLGINPVIGGIPLKDNNIRGISAWISGECLIETVVCEIRFNLFLFMSINSG